MSDLEKTKRRLREFVVEETRTSSDSFGDSTLLFEAGLLDSLALVSLVAFCEERFGCRIPVDEITYEAFQSIDSMAERIVTRWAS